MNIKMSGNTTYILVGVVIAAVIVMIVPGLNGILVSLQSASATVFFISATIWIWRSMGRTRKNSE